MRIENKNLQLLWKKVLSEIKNKIDDERVYNFFLKDSKTTLINDNKLCIVVNSRLAKQTLSDNYYELIEQVVKTFFNKNYSIFFLTEEEIENKENDNNKENKEEKLFSYLHLDEDMTFENFVVGDSNEEAYKAAMLIANNKDNKNLKLNPLFIYSDSGLGKTHLINAIGNKMKEKDKKKVLYTTAEEFFNEYIHIAKGEKYEKQMLDYFRNIDIFLIDDIQFFAEKRKCQELFFTIFSYFINNNKQVIITSDKQPQELKNLENRLISRFTGGLTVSIKTPNINTSIEIAKLYANDNKIISKSDSLYIDEKVFEYFAKNFSKNIRELKGVINKLLFSISIKSSKNEHIFLDNAIEVTNDYLKIKNNKLSENKIIDKVSNYYSLTPAQLLSNIRTSQISLARHIAMYLIRELMNLPFEKIGNYFNGKNHSTVISAYKNVNKKLKNNQSLQAVINELKKIIVSY